MTPASDNLEFTCRRRTSFFSDLYRFSLSGTRLESVAEPAPKWPLQLAKAPLYLASHFSTWPECGLKLSLASSASVPFSGNFLAVFEQEQWLKE